VLSGTPSAEGMAYFDLYIGEQMCTYGIYIRTTVGAIASLNCGLGYTNNEFIVGRLNLGNTLTIPYSGGNGGNYSSQVINSTEVTGLTATLPAGTLNIGDGVLVFTLSGTTTNAGYALFNLDVASKICIYPLKINSSTLSTNTPTIHELEVYKHENIIYFKNNYLDLNYQIVDINGKKLSNGSLKKTETSLDIKDLELPKGIIFIIVDTKEGSKTYKLSSY